MSKTIQIVGRTAGRNSLTPELKNQGYRIFPYCTGKYIWDEEGQKQYVGQFLEVHEGVVSVWVERRQDSEGPYAKMMCVTSN